MRVAGTEIDVDATVKAVAFGRIGLGLSYLVTPGLATKVWPGRAGSTDHDEALLRMMARHTGGRDIGLGVGALLAQRHGAPVRGWLEAAMLADVLDAVSIVFAFRHLPRTRAILMLGAALGTAAAGRRLARTVG
ncbi:MAG TPA: hypothetical protein VM388_05310 [Acidimicrobiales bacterium]|nr:hypothetical protein [Acidimicrobiales bacterium]